MTKSRSPRLGLSKREYAGLHSAVLSDRRRAIYSCPRCGVLGDLAAGVEHAVGKQFDMRQEGPLVLGQ